MAEAGPRKPWGKWTADTERAFLLALRLTGQARKAAAEIGRSRNAAFSRRRTNAEFARAWDAVVAEQQAEWIAATQARLGEGLDSEADGGGGGRLTPWRDKAGGWDARKRGLFLRSLARTKTVAAACRAAGMSSSAAYYLRSQSSRFARAWEKALRDEAPPSVLEVAFERAVNGWVEPVFAGGKIVGERRRYSDGLLRDLLRLEAKAAEAAAAAAAEKFEEERRAGKWVRMRPIEEVRASILRKVEAIIAHDAAIEAARAGTCAEGVGTEGAGDHYDSTRT